MKKGLFGITLFSLVCAPLLSWASTADPFFEKRQTRWLAASQSPQSFDNIQRFNQIINQSTQYQRDEYARGVNDHWASPMETLRSGSGDCEDFAIVKYYGLLAMGIPKAHLMMMYAFLSPSKQAHMTLVYRPDPLTSPWVLDNTTDQLKPLSARADLRAVYAFNEQGVWLIKSGQFEFAPRAKTFKRWTEVITKNQNNPVFLEPASSD